MRTFLILGLPLLVLVVAACSPPTTLYSLDPVDPRGRPLPLATATTIHFEDGTKLPAGSPGTLRIEDGQLVRDDGRSWPLASVEAVDWLDAAGDPRRTRLETPADLQAYDELPRIEWVRLRDGRRIELGEDNPWSRWSDSGLELEVSLDGYEFESLPIEELHSVQLHTSSLVDSTVKSWKFWAVGASTVILVWIVSRSDEDALAVE